MDKHGDFFTTINININTPHESSPKQYKINVLNEAALSIRQYGFPGIYLLIEGIVDTEENVKIIAEKVIFLDTSEPNTSTTYQSNTPITSHPSPSAMAKTYC